VNTHYRYVAVGGAAVLAAAVLAACGSGGTPASPAGSPAPQPAASATVAGGFNAADVAFTQGMVRLENQSAAMAALVAGHTTTPQLRQFAARLSDHLGDMRDMQDWMRGWHQPVPSPYSPGATPPAGMGPGMMDFRGWDEMGRHHGQAFNQAWVTAMISHHAAEIALCRTELRSGASRQARALARAMLTERQAELTQLRHWHQDWTRN